MNTPGEELGFGCGVPHYEEYHNAPKEYAKLCITVGIPVRNLDFMDVYLIASKIQSDEYLRKKWLASGGTFDAMIDELSNKECGALLKRIQQ